MSGGAACKCSEKHEPFEAKGNRAARLWRVNQRHCNHSAFNGGHYTPSKWSSVMCVACGCHWRTKSSYVSLLPDRTDAELYMGRGGELWKVYMIAAGREVPK